MRKPSEESTLTPKERLPSRTDGAGRPQKRPSRSGIAIAGILALAIAAGGLFLVFREGPLQHTSAELLPDACEPTAAIPPSLAATMRTATA